MDYYRNTPAFTDKQPKKFPQLITLMSMIFFSLFGASLFSLVEKGGNWIWVPAISFLLFLGFIGYGFMKKYPEPKKS